MENVPFGVQLEFLRFEPRPSGTSHLAMHVVYESSASRDQLLKLPFAQGINRAHNLLQGIMSNLK